MTRRVFVAGATGYIGRRVVAELVDRGHHVCAFSRERAGIGARLSRREIEAILPGAEVRFGFPDRPESVVNDGIRGESFDVFVSCLASRSGGIKDSWRVDHDANRVLLEAAQRSGAAHFVLLSAICVQHPVLAFQHAKLAFESALRESPLTHSIVRPTAFFKSLAGQIPNIRRGKPFLLIGPGDGPPCRPISERDLARFMAECVEQRADRTGTLPVGGPGPAITPRQRGEMLFRMIDRRPRFRRVPLGLFSAIITALDAASRVAPALAEKAEFARIGRFYATEPMLLMNPATGEYSDAQTPAYGHDTLAAFYAHALEHGLEGQELGDQALF